MREERIKSLSREIRILEQKYKRKPKTSGSESDLVVVFESDFTDASFAEWDTVTDWVQSGVAYHGSYSAKQSDAISTFIKYLSSKYPVLYCRFYLRWKNLGTPASRNLAYFYDKDGVGEVVWLFIQKDNGNVNFRIYNGVLGYSSAGSTNIQSDTWYCVEVRAEIGTSASIVLFINGVQECSLSGNTSAQGTGVDTLEFTPDGFGISWDELYLDYLVTATTQVGCG